MTGEIRYEVECQFCKKHIGGNSADEAVADIVKHDASHPICKRVHEISGIRCSERVANGTEYCDDHWAFEGVEERIPGWPAEVITDGTADK